jgi:hypothetical protein
MIIFFCYIIFLMFRNLLYSRVFMIRLRVGMIMVIFVRGVLPRVRYELIYMLKDYL